MLSTLNKISNSHNNCEDSFKYWINESIIYGAVSDGCSTGKNSHFASQLYCKCSSPYNNIPFLSDLQVLRIFYKLENYKQELKLEDNELWATLILFEYNIETRTLKIRCFGDGVYYINDKEYIIDQGNQVHYLADQKDILTYLEFNPSKIYTDVHSFRICSDGINQISLPNLKTSNIEDAKAFILSSNESPNHLERKYNIIKKQNWINTDDLTIIAYDSLQQK